ncbi:LOW QUALITY PROTEIN: uncharacterized protein J5M81_015399 [Pluvialis apricaria]
MELRHVPPSLTTLEPSCCGIPDPWFCSSTVKPQLQLHLVHNIVEFPDDRLLRVSSQSRRLSLFGTHRVTDRGFPRAAPHLECCALRYCDIQHMKHLQFPKTSDACSLTSVGLAFSAALRHLGVLCLKLRGTISLRAIIALCQVLPQLRNLKLGRACFKNEIINKIQASLPHCGFSHNLCHRAPTRRAFATHCHAPSAPFWVKPVYF